MTPSKPCETLKTCGFCGGFLPGQDYAGTPCSCQPKGEKPWTDNFFAIKKAAEEATESPEGGWEDKLRFLMCDPDREDKEKAIELVRQLLLSSRQSAVEECVKVVENRVKLLCNTTDLNAHNVRDAYEAEGIYTLSALHSLRRPLREESEDKKDV